jgi:arylsulfatase A-like enzyme
VKEEGKGTQGEESSLQNFKASRRTFLKTGAGTLGGLVMARSAFPSLGLAADPEAPRPNFVIFIGEGVRADEYGCTGNKLIATPNVDRIAKEGIAFPNAFVVNALCLPSRASILTGLYSHSTGCIDNRHRELPPDVPTIADLLRAAGYEVAFVGKAHIHNCSERNWHYYFGIEDASANYYHPVIIESHDGKGVTSREYDGYVDDVLVEHAVAWLKQQRDKPFCLFMCPIAPHAPFYRPRRHLDMLNGVPIPKPSTFDDDLKGYPGKPRVFRTANNKIGSTILGDDDPRSLEEIVKDHYVGAVVIDDCVGRVFETLEQMGKMDSTAAIMISDHGFFLGEWRFYDKRLMHEPSIRVPMMLRYPRLIKPGLAPPQMALDLDLPPTVLELAGLKVPEWMQGQSLVPFLKGSEPAAWRKDWLYEYYEYPGFEQIYPHRGIRTERYKLIHYYLAPEEFELYDLQEDRHELHNLYGQPRYAQLVKELRARIEELRQQTGDRFNYETPTGQKIGQKAPS